MCFCFYRCLGCRPLSDNHKKVFERVAESERRQCTNVTWLFLFLFFLIGMLYLGFYSAISGDPLRLFYPLDIYGNRCGMENYSFNVTYKKQKILYPGKNLTNKPFVFPLDINYPNQTIWTCVQSCPQIFFDKINDIAHYIKNTSNTSLCVRDFNLKQNKNVSIYKFSNQGPCSIGPIYKSKSVLNRCLPENLNQLHSATIENLKKFTDSQDYVRQFFNDFYSGRFVFIAVIFVSLIVSICITYSMIYDNSKIVYVFYITTMPCGVVCLITLICTSFYNFISSFFLETKYLTLNENLEWFVNKNRVDYLLLFFLAILVLLFTIVSWIVTWTLFKPRQNLISELFFQARKPLISMLWLVIETIFNCFFSLLLFALWTYVFICLLSFNGKPEIRLIHAQKNKPEIKLPVISPINMHFPIWFKYALAYHIFGFFWIKSFLSDAQKIFVGEATTSWYFGESRKSEWKVVYFRALFHLFRYHLGTVAFGSFLLMFVQFPSHIYLFLYYKLVKSENSLCVRFNNYFFTCLLEAERFLRYIHSNAYAVVGANGEDFLAACRTATNLWMDNSWNLMTTNTVARLLFLMTKCAYSLMIAFICGIYFRLNTEVDNWIAPSLFCFALAYFIMHRFFSLHEMIIETMFLCYASEIDGYDSQRQIAASGLPKKADYGFNYYMARRIYEERLLNYSSMGLNLSAISKPLPQTDITLNNAEAQVVNYENTINSNANEIGRDDLNRFQTSSEVENNYYAITNQPGRRMTSTPRLPYVISSNNGYRPLVIQPSNHTVQRREVVRVIGARILGARRDASNSTNMWNSFLHIWT